MSCCRVKDEARQHSDKLSRQLKANKSRLKRTVKILLLGSGESGKSTFLKQMRIIHGKQYSEQEKMELFRPVIYSNIIKGSRVMLVARERLNIPWHNPKTAEHAAILLAFNSRVTPLDQQVFTTMCICLRYIWSDLAIQEVFRRRTEYQLTDSIRYFLDNLDRIGDVEYIPSTQDILHSRKATTNIREYDIYIHGIPFKFVDVGGQRSQRPKWYQCFESVASILFIVSSSEYDQALFEDKKTNRLGEALDIYDTVVNNLMFESVCIIVFLNKSDLLAEKVMAVTEDTQIGRFFPQFRGNPRDLQQVQNFQKSLFESQMKNDKRVERDYFHCTTATDTGNINTIFAVVKENILRNNLTKINIMLR